MCAAARAQPTAIPGLPAVPFASYASPAREEIGDAYRRATARPDDAARVGALGRLLHAWDQFAEAADVYARAQMLEPGNADWWYLGGVAATRLVRHTDAVRQFMRAADLAPGRPLVRLRLADAYLASGESDAAAALYRELVAQPEWAAAAWYGLGRIHMAEKADRQARAALEQALAHFPEFGAAHYAMAQLQRRAGEPEAARRSLVRQQQCLACAPVLDDPWQDEVAILRTDAAALLTRGIAVASSGGAADNAEAIRLHEAALGTDRARGQALVNLVELYGRTGNAAVAEQHYREAVAIPGFAADAHRAYGVALLSSKQPAEALDLFRQATAIAPGDAAAHEGMALSHEILGNPAEAVQAYTAALRASPSARSARFGLARALVRLKRFDQAIVQLEELREPRDAESARYLFALAVAYMNTGRVEDARRMAGEAIDVANRFDDRQTAALIEAELRKLPPAP